MLETNVKRLFESNYENAKEILDICGCGSIRNQFSDFLKDSFQNSTSYEIEDYEPCGCFYIMCGCNDNDMACCIGCYLVSQEKDPYYEYFYEGEMNHD